MTPICTFCCTILEENDALCSTCLAAGLPKVKPFEEIIEDEIRVTQVPTLEEIFPGQPPRNRGID